jgi:uncharacterized cupredoxin-like copper-binding protein
MRTRHWLLASGLTMVAGLLVAGCGGSSSSDTTSTAASSSGGGSSLTVRMTDFKFTPSDPTVNAGNVQITAPNSGKVEHELVLFKTNKPAGSLPVHGNEVDEEGIEASGVESPGEIEEVGPGETKSNSFKLQPGKYVMICNIPGHYKAGMYGTITVK